MAALNNTVASVLAREYVFVFTCANARTGREVREAGKHISSVRYIRSDVLNENGKLLLGFAEDNKLAILNIYVYTPLKCVSMLCGFWCK